MGRAGEQAASRGLAAYRLTRDQLAGTDMGHRVHPNRTRWRSAAVLGRQQAVMREHRGIEQAADRGTGGTGGAGGAGGTGGADTTGGTGGTGGTGAQVVQVAQGQRWHFWYRWCRWYWGIGGTEGTGGWDWVRPTWGRE